VEDCQWVGKLGTLWKGSSITKTKKTKFEHSLLPLKYLGTRTAAAEVKQKQKFEHSLLPLKNRGTRVLHGQPWSLFCSSVIFYLVECLFQYIEQHVSNM
jgi:hypothetical protein